MIQELCSKDFHQEEKPRVWVAVGGCGELRSRELVFRLIRWEHICKPRPGFQLQRAEIHHPQSLKESGCVLGLGLLGSGGWGTVPTIANSFSAMFQDGN